MAQRLKGRVAVVTGAANGIGLATTRKLLTEGARVVAVDLQWDATDPSLSETAALRRISRDIGAADAASEIVGEAVDAFGRLDILVNNAGIFRVEPLGTVSDESWGRTFDVNVAACFRLVRAGAVHLRESGCGRIVNIASVNAIRTAPGLAAYSASKGALAGLTKALAVEFGPAGVTANYILPGAILTKMTQDRIDLDPEIRARLEGFGVLGRMGQPEDIANAVVFLASDDACFITGHGLAVDGGFLAKG